MSVPLFSTKMSKCCICDISLVFPCSVTSFQSRTFSKSCGGNEPFHEVAHPSPLQFCFDLFTFETAGVKSQSVASHAFVNCFSFDQEMRLSFFWFILDDTSIISTLFLLLRVNVCLFRQEVGLYFLLYKSFRRTCYKYENGT